MTEGQKYKLILAGVKAGLVKNTDVVGTNPETYRFTLPGSPGDILVKLCYNYSSVQVGAEEIGGYYRCRRLIKALRKVGHDMPYRSRDKVKYQALIDAIKESK